MFINLSAQIEADSKIKDFIDHKWIGHYKNSEDSNLVHIIKWKF